MDTNCTIKSDFNEFMEALEEGNKGLDAIERAAWSLASKVHDWIMRYDLSEEDKASLKQDVVNLITGMDKVTDMSSGLYMLIVDGAMDD